VQPSDLTYAAARPEEAMERLADGTRIVDAAGAEPPEVRVVRAHGGSSPILPPLRLPLPPRFQALGYGLLLTRAVGEAGRDVTRALGGRET
jgi:hypothetical protein